MHVETLEDWPMPRIHAAFVSAFSDYQGGVARVSQTQLRQRCRKNGIAWRHSAGLVEGGELVGLMLTGLGGWRGEPAAYDIATGLKPPWRGRGGAGRLFDGIVPGLRRLGTRRFVLEALRSNEAALRAYERVGFSITREFHCYLLDEEPPAPDWRGPVRPGTLADLAALRPHFDFRPSWENSLAAVARDRRQMVIHAATDETNRALGAAVYYRPLNWLVGVVVHRGHRGCGIARRLLSELWRRHPAARDGLRCNNIPADTVAMPAFLASSGFRFSVGQYEMECELRG